MEIFARVVPNRKPHKPVVGDASVAEYELVKEESIGAAKVRVSRPVLTEEERVLREEAFFEAWADLVLSMDEDQ